MKYIRIIFILILTWSVWACKNSNNATQTPTAQTAPTNESADPSAWRAMHVFNEARADTVQGTYQIKKAPAHVDVNINEIPPPNTSRRAYMSTGYWFPLMAYQPSDTTVHKEYIGKNMVFREDQTFDIVKDDKVVETGKWNFDDNKYIIYLSCKDPYLNNTWKVIEKGFTMIWIGQTELNFSGTQIRIENAKGEHPGH